MSDKEEVKSDAEGNSEAPASEKKEKKAKKPKKEVDPAEKKAKKAKKSGLDTPPVHDMLVEALDCLRERKGSSLQAIKRYMVENYKVDVVKLSPLIRKTLSNAVENGQVIQARGTNAMGRFKIKDSKPSMIKKRKAPEDYVELPMIKKHKKPRAAPTPKKTPVAPSPKQKPTKLSKPEVSSPKNAKPLKGRPGRKKKN